MLDALTITEAEAAGLSELAALDLAMARDFAARAQAAEDPDTANDLARSYQRMARSYRQSLALKVRLARDMASAERDAPPRAPGGVALARRIRELRTAVTRIIWAEAESPDHGTMIEEAFEDVLTREMLTDAFCAEPLDDHVARICIDLNLLLENVDRWRDLPDPPDEASEDAGDGAEPSHPAWRGSG